MDVAEPKVKGYLFHRAILNVWRKMGEDGVAKLGITPERFNDEKWYPYSEFCALLERTRKGLKETKTPVLFRLGHDSLYGDVRWLPMFKGKNPKEIFGTNARQDALFIVGRFEMASVENGLVLVRMTLWSKDGTANAIWAQYYHGMLQGVMDIAGRSGQVQLEETVKNDIKNWFYRITWI